MYSHAVWSLPDSHLRLWLVCIGLANYSDSDWWDGSNRVQVPAGSFATGQESLARFAGITRNQTRKGLKNLERIGSIRTKTSTKRYTVIEIVNWPIYNGTDLDENQEKHQPRTKQEPSKHQVSTTSEEGKKEKKERREPFHHDGFDQFWSAYPKKIGKGAARTAWKKLHPPESTIHTILAAIIRQKTWDQWTRDGGQFIPHPATWLNQSRWEDEGQDGGNGKENIPADPKDRWRSQESYLIALRAGGVGRKDRVPEWEPNQ